MAINWITVLKMVPWTEVISNAPKIAEGAKNLWSTVAGKKPELELSGKGEENPALSAEAQSIDTLQAQLAATESAVSDLHNQMLESSELIKALAEQNTQLIKRIEVNRIRVLWLAGVALVLGVITMVNLVILLTR